MSYTIEFAQCHDVMKRVARDIKDRHRVGDNEVIWPYITRDLGITIQYQNIMYEHSPPTTVTFPSESFYTFLLLKYS